MRTSNEYSFKYLPPNQVRCDNISIVELQNNQRIEVVASTTVIFDRQKLHDDNYLMNLVGQIHTEITKLHTFINGKTNLIFNLNPAKLSELKSALIRFE